MNTDSPSHCPACGHSKCVHGSVDPSDTDNPDASSFHPQGVRHWIRSQGATLKNGTHFLCCLKCGLIWNYVAAETVVSILEKQGVPKGEVPHSASYLAHLAKWIAFILGSAGLAAWIHHLRP